MKIPDKKRIMKIEEKRFKLPFLGKDRFVLLRRLGLGYNQGFFSITNLNNIENIKEAISESLDEDVVFSQTCIICKKKFFCEKCKFYDSCPSRDLPLSCICVKCYEEDDY